MPTVATDEDLVHEQEYYTTPMFHDHNHHHHAHPTTYHPTDYTNKPVQINLAGSNDASRLSSLTVKASTTQTSKGKAQQNSTREPIRNVTDHDVLCGRGVNIAHHPGNERFRTLITGRQDDSYCTSYSATEKKAVAEEIIRHIKSLQPPGRFLKRDGRGQVSRGLSGPWQELTEKEAVKKTCQALRDCNRVDRQGYAAGVAPPQDVMVSLKKRAMTGMTGKQQAAAAAARHAAANAVAAANTVFKRNQTDLMVPAQAFIKYKSTIHNPSQSTPGLGESTSSPFSQEVMDNIARVVDDTYPRHSSATHGNVSRQYSQNPTQFTSRLGDPIEVDPHWSKKQRTTDIHPFTHQLPSPDMLGAPALSVDPQNVIYDATHQEFLKVWTQTQSPHECLSGSKEGISDDFSTLDLSSGVTPRHQLSFDIGHQSNSRPLNLELHRQQVNTDINPHQLNSINPIRQLDSQSSEINRSHQLNSKFNQMYQLNPGITQGQHLYREIDHNQHLNISHDSELNSEIHDNQQLDSEIRREFAAGISQQLNPDIDQQMNPEIVHEQHLSTGMNRHHEELSIENAPQLVGSKQYHQLNIDDSDMLLSQASDIQPTPVAALTHPDLPLSKQLMVPDEVDLDNCVLGSIPDNLDHASKLIMNTPISSAKEDALQKDNTGQICPGSPVQLSTDFFK